MQVQVLLEGAFVVCLFSPERFFSLVNQPINTTMNTIPFSDPNYGIDNEIVEIVRVYGEDTTEHMIFNNITRQWAYNGKKFIDTQTARNAALRLVAMYSGLATV